VSNFWGVNGTMVGCQKRLRDGAMWVYVRDFTSGQEAADFFGALFSATPAPPTPTGPIREADALSWQFMRSSGGAGSVYAIAMVEGNVVVHLTVKSYSDKESLDAVVAEMTNAVLEVVRCSCQAERDAVG
jgi:hypothetical protein